MIGFLRKQGFRRGVVGNNRAWFAVWVGLGVARFLKSRVTRDTEVVERITLKPGQTIEIRDTGTTWEAFPSA